MYAPRPSRPRKVVLRAGSEAGVDGGGERLRFGDLGWEEDIRAVTVML